MQYFGGKARIAPQIAAYLQPHVDAAGAYVEPFVGACNVISRIKCPTRYAYDANAALIAMWRAVQDGWQPPTVLTEAEYAAARTAIDADPLKAFAGAGCSFGGKWFGGYARSGTRNYAANAANSIARRKLALSGVIFGSGDYRTVGYVEGAVVYCDPPYAGTTGYGAVGTFDSAALWDHVRELEAEGFPTFVSEYAAPADFAVVLEITTKLDMRVADGTQPPRLEKLFRLRGV